MPVSRRLRVPLPTITAAEPIEVRPPGDFLAWLAATGGTLAVTTYNSGRLACFSATGDHLVGSFWRFSRPMGLAASGARLALATRGHVTLFGRRRTAGADGRGDATAAFIVEKSFSTGRLDAHDLAFGRRGLIFANTRYNCVARPSDEVNFRRTWSPHFVPEVVAGDCCHLNGVGVRDGRLAAATAFCERGTRKAWREGDRFTSGVLIDAQRNQTVVSGLCLPHSPRWHDGRWWYCNSGEGTLCTWRPADGACQQVAELRGFTRGLCFASGRAVVGLSRIRKRHILDAPPVRQRCRRMRSGLSLIDPASGRETGSLEFVTGGREVYDVALIAGARGIAFAATSPEPPA
jgi:uncharacterized protein (TIGR03032 family)